MLAFALCTGCGAGSEPSDDAGATETDVGDDDDDDAPGDDDDDAPGDDDGPGDDDDDDGPGDDDDDDGPGDDDDDDDDDDDGPGDDDDDDDDSSGMTPPTTDVRNYIFGHSLLLHSNEANVPRWLDDMADAAGYSYGMSGQYGFADTHAADLPPFPQWGIEGVDAVWNEGRGVDFSDVGFTTVLFTEANFRQYYPPTGTDAGVPPTVDSTTAVFDWVDAAQPGVHYIVYENWPDMAAFTDSDFDGDVPTPEELAAYHAYTQGDFHQWWLDYHDALMQQRPDLDVKMVPAGPVLATLLTTTLADLPPEAAYEDNAPHGQPTLYFLAGIVTYMAIYAEPPPDTYVPPNDLHPLVLEHYDEIVDVAWQALLDFDDATGNSRVFF